MPQIEPNVAIRLEIEIGDATLGELIRIHRNRFLVHNDRFGVDDLKSKIESAAGIPVASVLTTKTICG